MLLREEGEAVIAIGQASHAWISGQLARAWGNDRFAPPEPREEVCLAAEQHDVAWMDWDLRPALNPETGRPYSFIEVPLETHIALWSAAPAKLLTQSQYAALLVSMHGTALNENRNLDALSATERALVRDYLDAQHELQRTLAANLAAGAEELARNQQLVWTWDSLSLALCLRWERVTGELALTASAPGRFTLDPWPFATDRIDVRCEGRLLEGRFTDEADLYDALGRASLVGLAFSITRA